MKSWWWAWKSCLVKVGLKRKKWLVEAISRDIIRMVCRDSAHQAPSRLPICRWGTIRFCPESCNPTRKWQLGALEDRSSYVWWLWAIITFHQSQIVNGRKNGENHSHHLEICSNLKCQMGELPSHTFNKPFLKRPPRLQDSELENAIYELLGLLHLPSTWSCETGWKLAAPGNLDVCWPWINSDHV